MERRNWRQHAKREVNMSNLKKQEKKKKKREKLAKGRVLARRSAIREEAKEKRAERDSQERARKAAAKAGLSTTYRKKEPNPEKDAEVMEKLEKNLEILKALEEESGQQAESRKKLNEELVATGATTPEEKLEAIKSGAVEKAKNQIKKKTIGGFAGGAECSFATSEPDLKN